MRWSANACASRNDSPLEKMHRRDAAVLELVMTVGQRTMGKQKKNLLRVGGFRVAANGRGVRDGEGGIARKRQRDFVGVWRRERMSIITPEFSEKSYVSVGNIEGNGENRTGKVNAVRRGGGKRLSRFWIERETKEVGGRVAQ